MTICLKSYILRKTCGFAQIAQNKNFVSCATFTKNISGFAQIAQKNSAKPRKTHCVSCAKIAQKFAKKICAKIAKNLRKRFSHFVETLAVHDSAQDSQSKKRKKTLAYLFQLTKSLMNGLD